MPQAMDPDPNQHWISRVSRASTEKGWDSVCLFFSSKSGSLLRPRSPDPSAGCALDHTRTKSAELPPCGPTKKEGVNEDPTVW